KTLGVEDEYGIEEGKPAHLVVFDAQTPVEVLRLQPVRRGVIRGGRVIAETTPPATRLFHEGRETTITFSPPPTGAGWSRRSGRPAGCSSPSPCAARPPGARSGT